MARRWKLTTCSTARGQIAKHVSHTRTDQSSDSEYGVNYWVNDDTTTTYYVHSSVLGGKTIVELNQNGTKDLWATYIPAARWSRHSTPTVFYNTTEMNCTNPVTGSVINTDVNASYPARQEPDPLGRDLTNPPDPMLVSEPLGNSLLKTALCQSSTRRAVGHLRRREQWWRA